MNLPKININLPSLRNLPNPNRRMSISTNSKSTYSLSTFSSTSNKSKESNPIPILIQLCMYPDENYSYRTIRSLLSRRYEYSPNICDEFGCNFLMYTLRYQRFQLFEYLLNDICLDLNFHGKDQYGNTILHYAILYSGNDTQIIEKLIDKYNQFSIKIDERNNFGFTPLLFAAFCGRYDFVLIFLTKTDASPFVRDYIQLKNMFDYIEIDIKHKESQNNQQSASYLNSDLKRFTCQLYQTIPFRPRVYLYKNFFQTFFLQSIQDQTGLIRLIIIQVFHFQYLTNLLNYLNQRYPKIQTSRQLKDNATTSLITQQENSKTNVHNILNLFDPQLKTKAIPPPPPPPPPQIETSTTRSSVTFKRLSTKLTTISAFSKTSVSKKRPSLTTTRVK